MRSFKTVQARSNEERNTLVYAKLYRGTSKAVAAQYLANDSSTIVGERPFRMRRIAAAPAAICNRCDRLCHATVRS